MAESRSPGEAAKRRDAGLRRLRRLTRGALVLGAAGVGVLASVAAGSSTGHRAARVAPTARATTSVATEVPAPAATVPVEEAAGPAAAPSQSVSPPTATSAPPVVVSGGS